MKPTTKILLGSCLEKLKELPEQSVQCCVTSPPYWGLRDYGNDGQLGLEATPDEYVAKMVEVFREVRRVLRGDGTLWLNLGDSYANWVGPSRIRGHFDSHNTCVVSKVPSGWKEKDLIGIPWRVAFALQADGWWLRQDIIWHKPAPMPESVTDRCTKAHEYVFLLTKQASYFYDSEAIKEPAVGGLKTGEPVISDSRKELRSDIESRHCSKIAGGQSLCAEPSSTRNKRSVWTVNTTPYKGAHFATFPVKLIEPMILAGTSEKGCCPTCGAPWERVVERGVSPPQVERWMPTCLCADGIDRSLVFSPLGERSEEDDPSLLTGRAGMNRPRGNDEGQRPITRYEQAQYAAQIKASSHLEEMRTEAGDAFAHYVRTDSSGARPVPSSLLDSWIDKGWLVRVVVPELVPIEPVPCTVLDPFTGSGTTLAVSVKLGRSGVGCELNPEYIKLAEERILRARGGVPDPWDTDQEEIEAPESFDSMEDLFGL